MRNNEVLVSNNYSRFYRGVSAYGEGAVTVDDLIYITRESFIENPEPASFKLYDNVTSVEEGVLENFLTLAELVVPQSIV